LSLQDRHFRYFTRRDTSNARKIQASVGRIGNGNVGAPPAGRRHSGLIHHSDRGVQYVSIWYTERLAEAAAVESVGSRGDSYDNAMAEAFNSLFKAELIRNKGPWRSINDLEIAVAEYIDWYNHRRLHGGLNLVTPAEQEATHYSQKPIPTGV
jgi:putative transposase